MRKARAERDEFKRQRNAEREAKELAQSLAGEMAAELLAVHTAALQFIAKAKRNIFGRLRAPGCARLAKRKCCNGNWSEA